MELRHVQGGERQEERSDVEQLRLVDGAAVSLSVAPQQPELRSLAEYEPPGDERHPWTPRSAELPLPQLALPLELPGEHYWSEDEGQLCERDMRVTRLILRNVVEVLDGRRHFLQLRQWVNEPVYASIRERTAVLRPNRATMRLRSVHAYQSTETAIEACGTIPARRAVPGLGNPAGGIRDRGGVAVRGDAGGVALICRAACLQPEDPCRTDNEFVDAGARRPTSLDVLENFTTARRIESLDQAPGHVLWALGEEMQRFAAVYDPEPLRADEHPVYIGGWPSANFWLSMHSPLLTSTLLYSGQVVVKDPLIDWFSPDRYVNQQVMGSRQGYLTDNGEPDMRATRSFLRATVPGLLRLKPLIEAGLIVLVAGETTVKEQCQEIDALVQALHRTPDLQPDRVTSLFDPGDLAKDDRIRGGFVFAGGNRDAQLNQAVDRALTYFAREYRLGRTYGANYAAPWSFEQYVCEHGLASPILLSESQRVVQALWSSNLPLFQGLTPKLLAELRDEDAFAGFRAELFDAYRGLPSSEGTDDDFARYVAEAESAKLTPRLQQAERLASRGPLAQMGVQLLEAVVHMATAYVIDSAKDDVSDATAYQGVASYLLGKLTGNNRPADPIGIWTKLSRHHRKVERELSKVQFREGQEGETQASVLEDTRARSWYIPEQPSMSVKVTPGYVILEDTPPPTNAEDGDDSGYFEGPYQLCSCGSGLKWRFCCRTVPGSSV